ncbi:hypothetical protein B4158_1811 [Bacillus cereus]|nr:hypothetical protein B4158_1811 [Bacillus cereus]
MINSLGLTAIPCHSVSVCAIAFPLYVSLITDRRAPFKDNSSLVVNVLVPLTRLITSSSRLFTFFSIRSMVCFVPFASSSTLFNF